MKNITAEYGDEGQKLLTVGEPAVLKCPIASYGFPKANMTWKLPFGVFFLLKSTHNFFSLGSFAISDFRRKISTESYG